MDKGVVCDQDGYGKVDGPGGALPPDCQVLQDQLRLGIGLDPLDPPNRLPGILLVDVLLKKSQSCRDAS